MLLQVLDAQVPASGECGKLLVQNSATASTTRLAHKVVAFVNVQVVGLANTVPKPVPLATLGLAASRSVHVVAMVSFSPVSVLGCNNYI